VCRWYRQPGRRHGSDEGDPRATHLDVYGTPGYVVVMSSSDVRSVSLSVCVIAECPLFSLCTMYHVPNNDRYEQDSQINLAGRPGKLSGVP